jgi:hypothetical protein
MRKEERESKRGGKKRERRKREKREGRGGERAPEKESKFLEAIRWLRWSHDEHWVAGFPVLSRPLVPSPDCSCGCFWTRFYPLSLNHNTNKSGHID